MIINPNNINVKKRPIYDSLRAHNGAQQHIAKMSTQTLAKAPQWWKSYQFWVQVHESIICQVGLDVIKQKWKC